LKLFGARLIDWGRALSLLTNTTSSRSGAETRWAFRDSQPAARLPLRLAYRFVPRRGFVWPRQVSRPATQTLSRNLHYQTFTSLDFWPALISSFNTQRIRESGVAEQVVVRCRTFALIRAICRLGVFKIWYKLLGPDNFPPGFAERVLWGRKRHAASCLQVRSAPGICVAASSFPACHTNPRQKPSLPDFYKPRFLAGAYFIFQYPENSRIRCG